MTLQRIRRNNEKIIFRIGDSVLAGPAGAVTGTAAKTWSGCIGGNEDRLHYEEAGVDAGGSTKILAYL